MCVTIDEVLLIQVVQVLGGYRKLGLSIAQLAFIVRQCCCTALLLVAFLISNGVMRFLVQLASLIGLFACKGSFCRTHPK